MHRNIAHRSVERRSVLTRTPGTFPGWMIHQRRRIGLARGAAGGVALALVMWGLLYQRVLAWPVVAVIVPLAGLLLAAALSRQFVVAAIVIGLASPAFYLTIVLDNVILPTESIVRGGAFYLAAGVAAGYAGRTSLGDSLWLNWCSIPVAVLVLLATLFSEPLIGIGLAAAVLVVPILATQAGQRLGSLPRWAACSAPAKTRPVVEGATLLLAAVALLYLAFVPAYVLDRIAFREPAVQVTLLDGERIRISPSTVKDGPFEIEYRVTNAGSEPHALVFRNAPFDPGLGGAEGGWESHPLAPGESLDAVMAISGGVGRGNYQLCHAPNGECATLTVK